MNMDLGTDKISKVECKDAVNLYEPPARGPDVTVLPPLAVLRDQPYGLIRSTSFSSLLFDFVFL